MDRVIFFDNELNLVGDTDTLDLDPRSFTTRLDTVELEILSEERERYAGVTKVNAFFDGLQILFGIILVIMIILLYVGEMIKKKIGIGDK